MIQGLDHHEMKQFLELKFKEKDFLDNLYIELSKIIADKSQISELNSDQLTKIILENNLLDKILIKDHASQRSTPLAINHNKQAYNKTLTSNDPFAPQFRTLNSTTGFNASLKNTLNGRNLQTGDHDFGYDATRANDVNSDCLGVRLGINLTEIVNFPLKSDSNFLQICVSFLESRHLSLVFNYT
jgi:hypothetical protein